ncbi:MAG: 3-hydroxyacyl-CoA dehydrogenase family protein [Bacteroidia bacterium]
MRIYVIGGGTMGKGIAEVFYAHQFAVQIIEPFQPNQTRQSLEKRGLPIPVRDALPDFVEAEVVIEAIVEDLTQKRELFDALALRISSACIVATNTSSLSVNALSAKLPYKERFVGWHFFNPAPKMPLVEVIPSLHTSPQVVTKSLEFLRRVGKTPVGAPDTPGFIVNRVARFYYLENLRLVESGVPKADGEPLTVEEIDLLWEKIGFRMGPFRLMDLIGIDINHRVSQELYHGFYGAARFRPSWLQAQKVAAGLLGRKTQKGFYTYEVES